MKKKAIKTSEYGIEDLIKIVSKLRDAKEGCPWDLKQTHKTLIPYVIEEAYEVTDAIRQDNGNNLCEELGDLLFQVILHAQIAKEQNHFTFNDITNTISRKMIRRHPDIFSQDKRNDANKSWEDIKNTEKPLLETKTPVSERIKIKIRPQPPLNSAMYISKKVAKLGFDWESIKDVWEKFAEELEELQEALANNDLDNAQIELGDLIFTLINIARWYELDPEEGLHATNSKFLERFSYIEKALEGNFANQSIKKLQNLWKQAKKHISSKRNN